MFRIERNRNFFKSCFCAASLIEINYSTSSINLDGEASHTWMVTVLLLGGQRIDRIEHSIGKKNSLVEEKSKYYTKYKFIL